LSCLLLLIILIAERSIVTGRLFMIFPPAILINVAAGLPSVAVKEAAKADIPAVNLWAVRLEIDPTQADIEAGRFLPVRLVKLPENVDIDATRFTSTIRTAFMLPLNVLMAAVSTLLVLLRSVAEN
jgi:hypothetical protein